MSSDVTGKKRRPAIDIDYADAFPTAQAVGRRFAQRGPVFMVMALNGGFVADKVALR